MNTDRKRLTSAIQRIARDDPEIRALLKEYRNAGGFPSESSTSESGGDDRQICCDGSSSGNTNPGSDMRDPSEGGQDAGDGLDPDDPANLNEMGPGSLTGVKDCTTGEPVCFEGSDWIPPEGWDSPTDPPEDPTWEEGFYWSGTKLGETLYFSTCGAAHAYAISDAPCGAHPNDDGCGGGQAGFLTGPSKWGDCTGDSFPLYSYAWRSLSCPGTHPELCLDEPPLVDHWPSDGCTNLAIKGGKIVGSKYDPENDGSYSKPRSSIELCDDYGNSFTLTPSASGGWKSISAQNPGDGYLYDSKGKQIARISGSEFSDPKV